VRKRSPGKATVPGAKQVFREYVDGEMHGDVIARLEEQLPGQPLLVPFVRGGRLAREETIEQMRDRARAELLALPAGLRELDGEGRMYPVAYSERCRAALEAVDAPELQ
jgi:nicotinate phosphoribosyltransferase